MGFDAKNKDHLLVIDENKIEVRVKHDPTVEYKPSAETQEIIELAAEIRKLKQDFLDQIYGPRLTVLMEKVKKYNYDHHSEVKKLTDERESKSKKIQKEENKKNFKDFIKKTFKKKKK